MRRARLARAGAGLALFACLLVPLACGDAETPDRRGYTKAPLEDPGLTIEPEPTTEMNRLGEPRLQVPATDSAAARPPAAPPGS